MDRLRCSHCRNPIKPHHTTSGPASGDQSYHEDCWAQAHAQSVGADKVEQQLEYQRRIAVDGLVALLSPYASALPPQRDVTGFSGAVAV